ncbi:MAG: HAMP domain-containing sensor histidine kinase [Bacteroidia bacterium]|nr:HAMP domain-containing sensor histidine kinase [Bacteroidia bacterium]
MQKRNTVLTLGILAILFIIAAQVIILRGLWKQQNEMLTLRYRSLTQDAVRRAGPVAHDTVWLILNKYSEKVVGELAGIKDKQKLEEKKKEIFEYFTAVLNREQDFTSYLSSYFEEQGFEKNFNFRIVITNLEITNSDTLVVYRSESFLNRRGMGQGGISAPPETSKSSISVLRQRLIGNYYAFYFEYYIDFSDKQKLILRETAVSLLISLLSILVVVIIFLITYRNLMEEKRLSNLKTDFINNMTHELKTPLATITVAGKTLEMEQIRTDEMKILETAKLIGKQSIHLNQLINMILEISMWERTEFQLDKKKVDIAEFMNDIVNSFKTGYGNAADLTEKYNFNGLKADVDLVYFTTMINNLLSNAVKYSDKDPVISVEGFVEDKNICIRVSDNGIGISKMDQKHVFDKFYRASSGNIHKYKGLGLGLYYVKKIVVAHGGDVTVTSKPGKGSIFTVTIPY